MELDEWVRALSDELGIAAEIDVNLLLDATRDVAHGVTRPAGPLATYLIGYKVAAAGGDPQVLADACARARRLAASWNQEG